MRTKKETIHFITTGGTIDSYYDGTKDTVVPYKKSIIPRYIEGLHLHIEAVFTQICSKDSRDLDLKDMGKIRDTIESSKASFFVITHGTYTMPDTARYLQANLKRKDCTIIFTGSMSPLEFPNSDAPFSLGFTFAEIFHLKKGIYVCMNGRIFDPGEIAKLIGKGQFVSIFSD